MAQGSDESLHAPLNKTSAGRRMKVITRRFLRLQGRIDPRKPTFILEELFLTFFWNVEVGTSLASKRPTCQQSSCDRSILHRAHPKRNALGGKVLAGTFLSHMAGRSLPFHSPVRFLSVSFRAMENPPTSAALAELDSDPDSPHLDQFPAGQQRSSLGLYHSLHNHLRHPDDRRKTWKEGRRVDQDLALGFSPEQGNG